MSQASKKGGMFDDVMRYAKQWAEKQITPAEAQKKKRAIKTKQPTLL